jgi:predicted ATPase/DNA-binding CsgD family transcriptional regulator
MSDRVGQQFGSYRLVALVGQGGFAEVYLGQHVRLPLQAAIKVLHTHLTEQEAAHFQREAETIAQLAHPSIVRILDYDVQDGMPFLVMDYAPGGSLRRRYPKGSQVPLPLFIASVKQVAAALQYAHERKVIHRDVKPENMLVGRREEVLLSDFGIATVTHSTASEVVHGTSGTVAYMAPEQIEGHPRAASDQYALGVVVYEWLCGQRPFEGSVTEVMVQHLTMPPPPLRARVPTLSAEIEQVALQALVKDPKDRFASVQDFALALEEATREESSGRTLVELSTDRTTKGGFKHNLPAQLTPLLGREQEVATVCVLLRRPDVRLLTLTGTGGIGKTRLGLQIATDLLADFADGVCFVPVAPISDPELVVPTIAQAFGLQERGEQPLLSKLQAYLRDKRLLLLLDNFEQLLSAAPSLAELLADCPQLKILVTSRATLHIQGEHEFAVPPLAVPDLAHLPEGEVLSQYAAVALFVQRAQAIKRDFQLTKANARAVAEICTRLDGLPLAIELAAGRIKLLPPQALLARLEHRLQILTSGAQNMPARQQTLRNTIAWSYDLLDAEVQRLFRWLSVFVGGCTLEAIEAVGTALGYRVGQVLDKVASLIDKSLLQQTEQEGKEPRLVLLETIREYGVEMLVASGEMEACRQAHAEFYLRLAEEAEPELRGAQSALWLERLERERDNLRAVMQWLLEQDGVGQRKEMALRLGAALKDFWNLRGPYSEGRAFLEQALAGSEGVAPSVRAKALYASGEMVSILGAQDRAQVLYEEGLALSRELGDTAGIARFLQGLGWVAWHRGNYTAARRLTEETLALWREVGDKERVAWTLSMLGLLYEVQGEPERARSLSEESLALHRELGNKGGMADALFVLAQEHLHSQGDPMAVRSLLEESLALYREGGYKPGMANCFALSARLALSQGDVVTARQHAEESVALYKETGDPGGITASLSVLGEVEASQRNYATARSLYEESLAIARKRGDKGSIALYQEAFASVVAAQGEFTWAARLWGATEVLREAISAPRPPFERVSYERAVAAARTQLGEQAFTAAWAEGRTMTPAQAFAAQERTNRSVPIPAEQPSVPSMKSAANYPDGLTAREVEVLRLVARGLSNIQVSEHLVISPRTVDTHLTSIYSKVGVSSRSAATRYALEHHLV